MSTGTKALTAEEVKALEAKQAKGEQLTEDEKKALEAAKAKTAK